MKRLSIFLVCLCFALSGFPQTIPFNSNWRFFRGAADGAHEVDFPDTAWKMLDVPHDWSIEDIPGTKSPFFNGAIGQVSTGFTQGGTGWYRKFFSVAPADTSKKLYLHFDGVYMNADFWLNGKKLGKHPYGYTSFYFDISGKVKAGNDNIIAVRVRNEGENSRWYSGSGIYRDVWLRMAPAVHIQPWGVYVTTPEVSAKSATIKVVTTLLRHGKNTGSTRLKTQLLDGAGKQVALVETTLAGEMEQKIENTLQVKDPILWDIENPALYQVVSSIYEGQQLLEETRTNFGIRSIAFSADKGFQLNGTTIKLKGGCVHHDNGPLGAKSFPRAEERKVALLKASGYNAIRTAHNPPSPAFLDACDRLGMLVIDEAFDTWNEGKNPADYNVHFSEWWQRDLESMLLRDRNHPSIIMWSTGNEIPRRERPEVAQLSRKLAEFVSALDPSRPVTNGVNGVAPDKDSLFGTLDVAGYNYAFDKYEQDHLRVPNRVMYASESFPIDAYDYWKQVEKHPYVIGDFVWTAFDYIGEASIGWLGFPQSQRFFPWNLAFCGDIDICGWKRSQSYYRDALWKKDQLSLFVQSPKLSFDTNKNKLDWSRWEWEDVKAHWNWKGYEGKPLAVKVYTSCETVELFLNGKSLGKKNLAEQDKHRLVWQVPYIAGVLRAVGYSGGKQVNVQVVETAGVAQKLKLTADRTALSATGTDLSYLTAEILDARGNRLPEEERLVTFEIKGNGKIIGVGNANPVSLESYTRPERKTWQGRCLAILSTMGKKGTIEVVARAKGLPEERIVLQVR